MTPDQIQTIRNNLELTQTQFAQLLGVHPLTISKWERGVTEPTPYQAALISSFKRAQRNEPNVGEVVAGLLIGAGIGVALYYLPKAAYDDEQ